MGIAKRFQALYVYIGFNKVDANLYCPFLTFFFDSGLGTFHAIPICCYDRSELVICTNSLEMHKTALYVKSCATPTAPSCRC